MKIAIKVRRKILQCLTVVLCASALIVLHADDNVCCGGAGASCDCHSACGNNFQCMGVVLDQITSCCGFGDGNVSCNYDASGEDCGFCTSCETGSTCGFCDAPYPQ